MFNIFIFLIFFFFVFVFIFFFFDFLFLFSFFDYEIFDLIFVFFFKEKFFLMCLIFVILTILFFLNFYLEKDKNFSYFFFFFLLFIFSMIFVNLSGNLIVLLISWDILGISSYFLVIFYGNWDSNNGGMVVCLNNRIGDYFFFVVFSMMYFSGLFSMVYLFSFFIFFILLTGFTKSAQFPFCSWLPKAMSAPTPVSALVHSSTLVTAGLIFMMKFFHILVSYNFMLVLMVFGLFTVFISGMMSIVESDMKKLVALSTLSQMGFSCFILSLGIYYFSFFHLISHAFFKSCLFIIFGFIIYSSLGTQDGRLYSGLSNIYYLYQFFFCVMVFCLCGLMFTGGMLSKDIFIEFYFFFFSNMFFYLFSFFCILMTFFYSFRMIQSILSKGFVFLFYNNYFFYFFFLFFISLFCIFFVWFMMWNYMFLFGWFGWFESSMVFYFFCFFFVFILMKYYFFVFFSFMCDFLYLMVRNSNLSFKLFDLFGFSFFLFNFNFYYSFYLKMFKNVFSFFFFFFLMMIFFV